MISLSQPTMQTTVSIPGIHCEGCSRLIQDVSKDIGGVTSVHVDLHTKKVTIEHEDNFHFDEWKKEIESLNPDYKVHPFS